ncbi:SNF2-family ATP dependent chromatin remodeling factor snf21 [Desarmillaria tabescens]|uniref:SNF2-family ATP dependent chromatin remodeling factor snf21 n=1 Tax=Armillaria tabescens TaxID=1929756 RepID=A0AA39KGQ4_ARMTA|nr:SNF2-family ATP dependent chromatin remodeling factor snf21 [Desarmillaria tabescens]KAK0459566.1 SNF2-family ATP dependent chromatin remodeling factor snf21 [Desarmillaria tabescens]
MSSSPTPSSSSLFMSEAAPSTAPSTPPPDEMEDVDTSVKPIPLEDAETAKKYSELNRVLQKSAMYSKILHERLLETKAAQKKIAEEKAERRDAAAKKGRKRLRVDVDDDAISAKKMKMDDGSAEASEIDDETMLFPQPSLITGAKLKGYQLEGLHWMVSLHQNGISGILADEMGLGKTLQTIAFSAYLRENEVSQAFLVVCPLSVLHNWVEEYAKFAPEIPVCMYHGTPEERAELRRTVLATIPRSKQASSTPNTTSTSKAKPKVKAKKGRGRKTRVVTDEEEGEASSPISFPVVVTTYEMIMKDRVHLADYNWGYIVVDEGHRLKNLNSKLMREIKKYNNASRMILTGTPLHNNLSELWALLNFVLPEIFTNVDDFEEWFNLPTMQTTLGSERSSEIIDALHAILKPFLLRRLKADVEANLPPKKEYVLYAPLSVTQRETYNKVLDGSLRAYLIGQEDAQNKSVPAVDPDEPRQLRKKKDGRKSYSVDGDDDDYFAMLEQGEVDKRGVKVKEQSQNIEALSIEHQLRAATKHVNNMRLQNTVMQLRKVCSHPFLFEWPLDPKTHQPALDNRVVDTSGKMMVLDRLLDELFRRKHKVLLFSQFTTMLDIIDDWAREMKGWNICRIDGSTAPMDRREQMNLFQNSGDAPGAPHLFLLSTRAGGLGINLTAADTVIFYDQDWNPQMDAQAQDRAHRIGQTKPVLIFRIVTAHTIETKIMQKATEKKKLEALVIAKGKFKAPTAAARRGKPETMVEMAASLLRLEGEKIDVVPETVEGKANVISDHDLDALLDRSPKVFADRGQGWTHEKEGKKAAFAVYEAPQNEGNDALVKMLSEDIE